MLNPAVLVGEKPLIVGPSKVAVWVPRMVKMPPVAFELRASEPAPVNV